jgi:hypothetical protein
VLDYPRRVSQPFKLRLRNSQENLSLALAKRNAGPLTALEPGF